MSRYRNLFATALLFLAIVLPLATLAVLLQIVEFKPALQFVGIAGGLASIIGLLSLTRRPLPREDLRDYERFSLGRIAQLQEEVASTKQFLGRLKMEATRLEDQQEKLEALARKSVISVAVRERIATLERRILEILREHDELQRLLPSYREAVAQLESLDEQVSSHEDLAVLSRLLAPPRRKLVKFTYLESVSRRIDASAARLRKQLACLIGRSGPST